MSPKKYTSGIFCILVSFLVTFIFGAPQPVTSSPKTFTPYQTQHWAFQHIQRPPTPLVDNQEWVHNPVDAFVVVKLESKRLFPSPRADRITLLRRAYFDLTGLPPMPDEVAAFLADESPDAFKNVVDQLLASPRYGERWARHWLDLARYAESEGFKADETRPNAWRYRDYVINSLNADKPYDRFVREQIAGDELWPDNNDALLATAFNRHYPDEYNAVNLRKRRQQILNDITDTVGAVFLGLTYGCARCHDHKFDPILQTDYYRLQSFFANIRAKDNIPLYSQEEEKKHVRELLPWMQKTAKIRQEMALIAEPKRKNILAEMIAKYPPEIQKCLSTPASERSAFQRLIFYKVSPYLDPDSSYYRASETMLLMKLSKEENEHWKKLKVRLDAFSDLLPDKLPIGIGIVDAGTESPPTHLLSGGTYSKPSQEVQPGFLTLLAPEPAEVSPPEKLQSSGRRTSLANWLVDPDNPLTARVMVNRIWHYHFGRGLVETPSNLGIMGADPSHPQLLDWLASEFLRNRWSIKEMHRLIMNSNTYQQSSLYRKEAAKIDSQNQLLWRFPRQRLEGEIIRDAALAVSGLLNLKMGGPSIYPRLSPGTVIKGGWPVTENRAEQNRRSIYVFVQRNTRYPLFHTFDMPDTHESCPNREITTTPLQALTTLNSGKVLEWAQALAGRVLFSAGQNEKAQIKTAYQLGYSRSPSIPEMETALRFLKRQRVVIANSAEEGRDLILPVMSPHHYDPVEKAALVDLCHMILNSNEFVYKN